MGAHDLSQFSMRDLFRMEAGELTQSLTAALLELERTPTRPDLLEDCMRAAHSLKGAARIVDLRAAVTVAHAMEDLFVAAQKGEQHLDRARIDLLLGGVDLLSALARAPDEESAPEQAAWQADADSFAAGLAAHIANVPVVAPPLPAPAAPAPVAEDPHDRSLRVSAENLNRMLDLAGKRWSRRINCAPSSNPCCASSACSARRRCRSTRWRRRCRSTSWMIAPAPRWASCATSFPPAASIWATG
jgi:two-component system sensor histidine kinase and response regulator WspE